MRYIFFLCLIWPGILLAQFTDDFTDGNLNTNPTWTGDTSEFTVVNQVLRLSGNKKTDTSYITCHSPVSRKAVWQVDIAFDFNPSSSNYLKIYLVSDKANLESSLNGYFIKAGGSDDEISLYRQSGKNEIEIIDGTDAKLSKSHNQFKIRVERDSLWNWEVLSDTGDGFHHEGNAIDSVYKESEFFGISCRYTGTRSDKMSFDNFSVSGHPYSDKIKPFIRQGEFTSGNKFKFSFSEPVDYQVLNINSLSLGNILDFSIDSIQNSIELTFEKNAPHGEMTEITIDTLMDYAGNYRSGIKVMDFYNYDDSIGLKDILINELMIDPYEEGMLPSTEYVELFNNGDAYHTLENWFISDRTDSAVFEDFIFSPHSYLLLIDKNDSSLWNNIDVNKQYIHLPSLNNSGDEITLSAPNGLSVDSVAYSSGIEKGRSIELIDPFFKCNDLINWDTSMSISGGSPGVKNSVHQLNYHNYEFSVSGIRGYSDSSIAFKTRGKFMPFSLKKESISVTPDLEFSFGLGHNSLTVEFKEKLRPGQLVNFTLMSLENCYGQTIDDIAFDFRVTDLPLAGDILINEVLFNPRNQDGDFVELYNHSTKYIDLQQLFLANLEKDTIDNLSGITDHHALLPPKSYMAVCEDSNAILTAYIKSDIKWLRQADLPLYANDNGSVILLNRDSAVIDRFNYHESMHSPFLEDVEGVSLERISHEMPSSNSSNWTSAASTSFFATPGLINSQFSAGKMSHFSLHPNIFSPNSDGYDDILKISFSNPSKSTFGSVSVLDRYGRTVIDLISDEVLPANGFCFWNGFDKNNNKVPMGYYLVLLETVGSDGNVQQDYKTVVIAGDLK